MAMVGSNLSKQNPESDTEINTETALGKDNMAQMFSILTQEEVDAFCEEHGIDKNLHPTAPATDVTISDMPVGKIGVYTRWFDFANIRFPISRFLLSVIQYYQVHISQISPVGLVKVSSFEIHCRALNGVPTLPLFRKFYTLSKNGDWLTIEKRKKPQPYHYLKAPDGSKDWKDRFFWVDARVAPIVMSWKNKTDVKLDPVPADGTFDQALFEKLQNPRINVQTFPEHVLVMAGISQRWDKPDEAPIIRPSDSDEELPLLEFMQLWKCSDARYGSRPLCEGEVPYPDRFRDAVVAAGDVMLQLVGEPIPDAPKMRRFKTKAKVQGSSARRISTPGTKAAVGSSAIKSLPIGKRTRSQVSQVSESDVGISVSKKIKQVGRKIVGKSSRGKGKQIEDVDVLSDSSEDTESEGMGSDDGTGKLSNREYVAESPDDGDRLDSIPPKPQVEVDPDQSNQVFIPPGL